MPSQGGRMSHQAAKRIAKAHLRAHGFELGRWTRALGQNSRGLGIAPRDPAHPNEMLIGGVLVVTPEGECHESGSLPDAVDGLMMILGAGPG